MEHFKSSKKILFCIYKMSQISKKPYEKCEIKIIDDDNYFWMNRRDLELETDWAVVFDKCDPKKQKYRHDLISNTLFQLCRVFVCNDLVERKIKSRTVSSKKILEFKEKLGLDPKKYYFYVQDIISALQLAFEGKITHTQYCVLKKRLDLYFSEHKRLIWSCRQIF